MKKLWEFIKRRKWWIVGLIVVAVIGGLVYYRKQQAKPVVQTVKPTTQDIVKSLNVSGNMDAHEQANLKFAAASKLTWLPIKEGDTVKKWQALASVDARQLQKQMEINQNLHGIQFRTTEQVLADRDYYSDSGLTDTERRTVESSQLQTRNTALTAEIQDISIKNATMVSPISGIVTKIDQPNVGALMMITDTIQVVNPATLYFAVVVDEADIAQVAVGQEAKITLDAFPEDELGARVHKIAFTPSQSQSGGLGYKISLELPTASDSGKFRLGMSGDAKIILNQQTNVMTIPLDAVVEREGKQYVEVMRNGVPEKTEITTGIDDGDMIEVLGGLSPQDDVVVPTAAAK